MLTVRQLEMVEGLFEVDPTGSYPARGAAIVAQLAGAAGHRLVVDGRVGAQGGSCGESEGMTLRSGEATLHLWARDGSGRFGDESAALARWGARLLGRGLALVATLGEARTKDGTDVEAMLASTPLTPRERDVVGRLVSGHSTRDIARATGLTVATVNTYLKRIFSKLGVHSRVELLARVTGTHNAVATPPSS